MISPSASLFLSLRSRDPANPLKSLIYETLQPEILISTLRGQTPGDKSKYVQTITSAGSIYGEEIGGYICVTVFCVLTPTRSGDKFYILIVEHFSTELDCKNEMTGRIVPSWNPELPVISAG